MHRLRWIPALLVVVLLTSAGCNPTLPTTPIPTQMLIPTATPVQVILPTPLPDLTLSVFPHYEGTLMIEDSPFVSFESEVYTIEGGTTVKIVWRDVPSEVETVDFYQVDLSGGKILLNRDKDNTDGIGFDWYAPRGYRGQIMALDLLFYRPANTLTIRVPAS